MGVKFYVSENQTRVHMHVKYTTVEIRLRQNSPVTLW